MKPLALILLCLLAAGCDPYAIGQTKETPPAAIELPPNPIERAAVQGLVASYRDSTMWQIQNPKVVRAVPVAPTAAVLRDHDPKELYCVCIEYEARYKVEWTTTPASPWERTVRNIMVMRTQADEFLATRPMNVCAAFCE